MKVIAAAEMGMCFGVRDALAAARAIADPGDVAIHGELVHNEEVLAELDARGFHRRAEADRDAIAPEPRILITAHGVSDRERARLAAAGKRLIDTTCPLVRFVHRSALDLAGAGYHVVVIGRKDHVEVQGIVGDLERFDVAATPADARPYGALRIGVVCQSTTRPATAATVLAAIRAANPGAEVRYVDTICGPTRNRQAAAEELLDAVEVLVVVGGAHSNNTRELARLARSRGVPACHVQSAVDLDREFLARFRVAGLTAGTSTLDATIAEVKRALESIPTVAAATAVPVATEGDTATLLH